MKQIIFTLILLWALVSELSSQNIFSINGDKTLLNGNEIQVIGLRCSNALLSDVTTEKLINQLDEYKEYGINTISVYFMGSRYSNINGYNRDGTLNEKYKLRMSRIIKACDNRKMVVLVGILYWGAQMSDLGNAYYKSWKQENVNAAIRNTVEWLKIKQFRNVFIDPDNEGMAERGAGFDIAEMICEGKSANPDICIAYNGRGYPPPCADLPIHFGRITREMPYIETEGTPSQYWGDYSKEKGLDHYINVGIYTSGKKEEQRRKTKQFLDSGNGYIFASTWLQNVPPNYDPGGYGSPCDPGIKWWLEFVKNDLDQKNSK